MSGILLFHCLAFLLKLDLQDPICSNFFSKWVKTVTFSLILSDQAFVLNCTIGFFVLDIWLAFNHFHDPPHDFKKLRFMLWYFHGLAPPLSWDS